MAAASKKKLLPAQQEELLIIVKNRFEKNMQRHKGIAWAQVLARLEANKEKMWCLHQMENTGGEPDITGYDKKTDEYIFIDCAAESPKGRKCLLRPRSAGGKKRI